jgi:phosphohistidine phosphatase SixA
MFILVATVLGSCATTAPAPASGGAPAATPALRTDPPLDALRHGGLYILMRHAADEGHDASPVDVNNCATQAALTPAARQQLAATAADFVTLRIPVATVLASPYCRTLETARIAFGRSATVADALQRPATPERTAALVALLSAPPASGSNVVLVSHREIIRAALEIDPALGEAFVVRPDGAGRFAVLARVTIDGWKAQ